VTTKEYDNLCYSVIGETYITAYKESENVVLNKKMKWYLSTVSAYLKKIQAEYKIPGGIQEGRLLKAIHHLKKHAERQALKAGGESIALMREDLILISMLDTIMFAYSEAVEKSKTIPAEVKKAMKMANSYWIGFEKYIVEGARC
jgi:hypothetical protein